MKLTRLQTGLVIAILAVATAGVVFLYQPISVMPTPSPSEVADREISADAISPSRLIIPEVGIDAPVVGVGVTDEGNMAVPPDYESVGWYEGGYQPGEAGHAVLAGHLDNGWGLRAVFSELSELQIGDTFFVVNSEGESLAFRVTEKNTYNFQDAPLEKVFGPSDTPKINLITCEGSWLSNLDTYQERLVVTAELIDTHNQEAATSNNVSVR